VLKLNELRAGLDVRTKKILTDILRHFQADKAWPRTRLINSQHGKDLVVQSLRTLNGGVVRESEANGFRTYELGIIGILLTDDGPHCEELLLKYLTFQRDLYNSNPQQEVVTADDLLKNGFSPDEVARLSSLILIANLFSHSASVGNGTFQCGVYEDADSLPPSGDLDSHLDSILFKTFAPESPVLYEDRISFRVTGSPLGPASLPLATIVIAPAEGGQTIPAGTDSPKLTATNLTAIAESLLLENLRHKQDMMKLIASGEALAFIGAGLSKPLGYPEWPVLLQKLSVEAAKYGTYLAADPSIQSSTLAYAQHIKNHFDATRPDKYFAFLGAEFEAKQPACGDNHLRLVELPFRGCITTNYDPALEFALRSKNLLEADSLIIVKRDNQDAHKVLDFLLSLSINKPLRYIVHLHGSQNSTKDIILTASDYREAYGMNYDPISQEKKKNQQWTLHRKLAWALMATRRMIFWGFSLTDPYILGMLNAVADDLWNVNRAVH
jgi:hypothetical protein